MSARYMCCACCVGDPVFHEDNPPNSHTVPCGTGSHPCPDGGRGDRRATTTNEMKEMK